MGILARLLTAGKGLLAAETRTLRRALFRRLAILMVLRGAIYLGLAGVGMLVFAAFRALAQVSSPTVAASVIGTVLLLAAGGIGLWAVRALQR